jgi:TRAP-type C4-dicarboxylate transport system permease small subunit
MSRFLPLAGLRNLRGIYRFSEVAMKKLLGGLAWLEDMLVALALGSVSIIVCAQVVMRYFFNFTPEWSEELSRYLIVWTIFIGAAIGVRENIHIGVDAVIRLMPEKGKLFLEFLLNAMGAIVAGVLIWLSIGFILDTIEYEQLSPAMRIPMYLPYLAMPVGLSFAIVHFIHDIVKLFVDHEEPHEMLV